MAINEFPSAQTLQAASSVEYKQAAGDRLCIDKVQLFFQDTAVTLLPLADTDEIEILCEPSADIPAPAETPFWCQPFLGKKLMTVWVCDNDQGYRSHSAPSTVTSISKSLKCLFSKGFRLSAAIPFTPSLILNS